MYNINVGPYAGAFSADTAYRWHNVRRSQSKNGCVVDGVMMDAKTTHLASAGKAEHKIDYTKKLPDAEFEVMLAVWEGHSPVNTAYLMEMVGRARGWKAPTLISFLVRLEERGYIISEKRGKERYYTPLADRDEYLRIATEQFVEQYHSGSFVRMMDSLYRNKNLSEEDIDDLLQWLKSKY